MGLIDLACHSELVFGSNDDLPRSFLFCCLVRSGGSFVDGEVPYAFVFLHASFQQVYYATRTTLKGRYRRGPPAPGVGSSLPSLKFPPRRCVIVVWVASFEYVY